MTVPDYQSLMLPLLQLTGDGQEHTVLEAINWLAERFGLDERDLSELVPSGKQSRYENRVHWAKTYLKQAGLLVSTGRGRFCITERGMDVLSQRPAFIDRRFLEQFPEFRKFRTFVARGSQNDEPGNDTVSVPPHTPEETLETAYQTLRAELAQELIERVMRCSPRFFERLVVDLLVAMGYGGSRQEAGQVIGQSGDGGIDGIIKEDRLGLDVVYVQAKRWENTVGRPVVQGFAGSLEGHRARKGVLITTSSFSKDAKDYVERIEKKIVLIDGEQLAQLMIDYHIGTSEVITYTIKKVDLDYFGEE